MEGHGDQAGPINVNDANDDEGDSDDEAYNGIDLISDSEGKILISCRRKNETSSSRKATISN